MKGNKIWIVTELFYPEETAVAYIFTRIANYLSKSYKVSVICGPEFYDNNKRKFIDEVGISDAIEIFRIKSFSLDKNSLFQRTFKIMILSVQIGILMCKKISKGETVLLATNPSFLLLFVRFIKYFKKIKLHILVHDVFPENAIPARIFKNEKVVAFRIIKFLFDRAYACADHLIVIGRDMKEIMFNKVSHSKTRPSISIVPNWTNPEKFTVITNLTGGVDKLVLQYAGNIGRVQGLLELLDAFRICNNKNLYLILRGTGACYSDIENYIKEYKLENVDLKGSFSRNEENEILTNCDIGIVSLSKGMYGLGVPSKAYHLSSAGKPILYIGEPGTEISDMVLENDIGWSLDIKNQKKLIEFFRNLSSIDRYLLIKMGNKARLLAERDYNESTVLKLLQLKIESVNS